MNRTKTIGIYKEDHVEINIVVNNVGGVSSFWRLLPERIGLTTFKLSEWILST